MADGKLSDEVALMRGLDLQTRAHEIDSLGLRHPRGKIEHGEEGEILNVTPLTPLPMHDMKVLDLLGDVVAELRIMNAHMAEMTGETFLKLEVVE